MEMAPRRLLGPSARVQTTLGDDVARSLVECSRAENAPFHGPRAVLQGSEVVVEGGPLAGRATIRHGLRRWLLLAPSPCEAESRNLTWMRKRLFHVPEPLGAVTLSRLGFPTRELLVTRPVKGARPFVEAIADASPGRRRELFTEFGREVGRMHSLRFLHGDLVPDHVLVTPPCEDPGPGHGRSLVWLATRRGGPTAWRRGHLRRVADDLGAWFGRAADWMAPSDVDALLLAYVASRACHGRPVTGLGRLVASIQRSRRREMARLEARPDFVRGRAIPIAGWDPDVGRLRSLMEREASTSPPAVVSPPPVV